MNEPKEYYNEGNLKITYEPERDGYWLNIKHRDDSEGKYFIDNDVFQDILNSGPLEKLLKLDVLNPLIQISINKSKISATTLCHALKEIKEREQKEFEDFKKANNL